ncbi:MAG: hypothetical protein P1U53_01405 [Sulfitobacter sp.]|nr:hypothetical protein [Sulfitobacter sp.]
MRYDADRKAHLIEGIDGAEQYRLLVPRDLLDDELGPDAPDAARDTWIKDNLPQILSAYTARSGGGWVKAPWNRILVEEIT